MNLFKWETGERGYMDLHIAFYQYKNAGSVTLILQDNVVKLIFDDYSFSINTREIKEAIKYYDTVKVCSLLEEYISLHKEITDVLYKAISNRKNFISFIKRYKLYKSFCFKMILDSIFNN